MRKSRNMVTVILLVSAIFVSGCSGDGGGSEPSVAEETSAPSAGGTTALSNIEEANTRASEWNEDAELYAIAAATPQLDAEGNSPGWLYTYVSGEAGAVATVSVEGGTVAMDPEQELPEADVELLSENALPPSDELLDSSEAMEESAEVGDVLAENPGSETAAGLDSVSGGSPVWILSTLQNGERVEERVPAVEGAS